jgi:rhodanese-related sulfurtransferase
MRLKLLGAAAIAAAVMFSGCASSAPEAAPQAVEGSAMEATPAVAGLIKKFNLEVVDYEYTKAAIGNGTRTGAKALLIDARPEKMYMKSTIPSSLNIPDTAFDKFVGQLDNVAKDKEILVYCGGWACGKSPKVAGMLKAKGFTNVKLYQAGEPEWKKMTYVEVGSPVVASAIKKGQAVIIDARPAKMFAKSTIPTSINIPDTEFAKYVNQMDNVAKDTEIITFCGGYACEKSHIVAEELMKMGYTNLKVYAGGLPQWKSEKREMVSAAKPAAPKAAVETDAKMVNGIKPGVDEGTVDGEWFKENMTNLPNVQIVDVRSAGEHATGALPGAINIEAGAMSAADFVAKLPADKVVIFHCASGGRAMEAQAKAIEGGADASKVYYFDANINCASGKCEIEVNEPLG